MKKLITLFLALAIGFGLKAQCPLTQAVDFTATDVHGTEVHLFDILDGGQYVLVDFWASWCGPCRKETPNVVAVFEKYRDKGLIVIGVPVNDKQDAMVQALKDLGIHYPQVIDPSQALADRFHVSGIPYILLFDPDGNIVADDLREAQIEEAVKKVL